MKNWNEMNEQEKLESSMDLADQLLKKFDEISRECFEREMDTVETFVID